MVGTANPIRRGIVTVGKNHGEESTRRGYPCEWNLSGRPATRLGLRNHPKAERKWSSCFSLRQTAGIAKIPLRGFESPEKSFAAAIMNHKAQSATATASKSPPGNAERKTIPNKLYFPIREVAELVGVEPYVLRFWEKEFPMLSPVKESTGHRRYRRKDIEMVLEIKRLLYDQGFTIPGARTRLQKANSGALPLFASAEGGKPTRAPGTPSPGTVLRQIRRSLNELLTLLDQS